MLPYFLVLVTTSVLAAASTGMRAKVWTRELVPAGGGTVVEDTAAEPRRAWTMFDVLALLILVAFAGSRIGVGSDYFAYVRSYLNLVPGALTHNVEVSGQDVGFVWLQMALKMTTGNAQALFWVAAVLTVVPVFVVIKMRSKAPALAVWLYVALGAYLTPFNVVRQGIAVTLVLVAVVFFADERRWGFVALAAAATLLHASALPVAVVLYATRNWHPRPRTMLLTISFGAMAAGFIVQLSVFHTVALAINPRYDTYVVTQQAGYGTYLIIAATLVLVLIGYAYADHLDRLDRRYLLYATIGVATLIVGTQALVLTRLSLYFTIFLVLVIPNVLKGARSVALQLGVTLGAAAYMAVLVTHYAGLLGYRSTLF